ncbi:MAG: Fe(3+) ABC transporter substrate-binding protein [Rhodocyclaceae bacterium]|nr:Fe(3+) ABC transporter substrate-binding protein [Rhodocyclaceae bacterium]MCA3024755.1 Fe(3+) ABC transporter substrate-binding protein [Rhodocyclaceae bacterium]MCA3027026.1 Fe(3+) ABC transporter substrate-binding protein [Rhodocyclaceae bacterium]MCA3032681.1 Fe(3+) ABC transporter substrate-binding protein [Rhodocyclaceae bacterium]MCA3037770.1 Fe(3+) ABC transporter substrate-binding protein [Rhodocyclaceae bacterium]
MKKPISAILAAAITTAISTAAAADSKVLNLYSSRHYQTDEALYTNFEKKTGIKINRIEGPEDPLLERMKSEGTRSPADVLITVDMGRLMKAQEAGLFQPIKSSALENSIPAELRAADGSWFGFSIRARPIIYAKGKLNPTELPDYESLADPKWKGKICVRSGSHPYNISMLSSIIAAHGPAKAEDWARGVVANMARAPKGGDTDQIKAVAAGECDITISNTYYFARLLRSDKPEDKALVAKVGVIFPNQTGANARGTHINISGAGVARYAPNKDNAIKFLEYLATPEAQRYFADGNNEYPAVGKMSSVALDSLGTFKRDPLKMEMVGKNYAAASQIFDRAGWK